MDKSLIITLYLLTGLMTSHVAIADSQFISVNMTCPEIAGDPTKKLTNYSTYITGQGIEKINSGLETYPLFRGNISESSTIPADLTAGSYIHASTNYDAATGVISCSYMSTAGYDRFDVSYTLKNSVRGFVRQTLPNYISLKLLERHTA